MRTCFKSVDRFDGLVLPAYLISPNQALREAGGPVLFGGMGWRLFVRGHAVHRRHDISVIIIFQLLLRSGAFIFDLRLLSMSLFFCPKELIHFCVVKVGFRSIL